MKKIIFCLVYFSLFSLVSCEHENSLGTKISLEEANQLISNYTLSEVTSFKVSSFMHTKTSVFLDANISKTNETYMYADVFADNDALNPYAFTGSLNYSLNDGNLVKEEISISIEEYTKNLKTFVYNFYITRYQNGNDELEINTNRLTLNDSSEIIFNANSLISVLQNSYHYLNMENVISPSMFEFYRLNNNLSLQLTFNQNNISKFINISSLGNISVKDLNIIGEEIYTFNEDGFINGSLVKEKVVYFDELNNETLGWFNVGDIQSVSRAVNLMNQNCKFNFFDKFEAVTKTSYSLELDDTYYKFFDADLFTYTREITIGHHSNLVDFIQVFN